MIDRDEARIDEVVRRWMEVEDVPGVTVAVQRGESPVWVRGWGLADVESGLRADGDTSYQIGSITKQFTAAAILEAVERGSLTRTSTLEELLPGAHAQGGGITLDHLLGQTSGLWDFLYLPEFGKLETELGRPHADLLLSVRDRPLVFPPGSRWAYSNTNYNLLGVVLERLSGRSYGDHLQTTLFRPLGLSNTRYCEDHPSPGQATGYAGPRGSRERAADVNIDWAHGAGGLCSTAGDLVRWSRSLAQGKVVSESSYQEMIRPRALPGGRSAPYGLGLSLIALDGKVSRVRHGGNMAGYSGTVAHYAELDLTVALLSNRGGSEPDVLETAIARVLLGLEPPPVSSLPLAEGERARFEGSYDTGACGLVVRAEGAELVVDVEFFGPFPLRRRSADVFVGRDEPDAIRLEFQPADGSPARSVTFEYSGVLHEAVRR